MRWQDIRPVLSPRIKLKSGRNERIIHLLSVKAWKEKLVFLLRQLASEWRQLEKEGKKKLLGASLLWDLGAGPRLVGLGTLLLLLLWVILIGSGREERMGNAEVGGQERIDEFEAYFAILCGESVFWANSWLICGNFFLISSGQSSWL